MSTACRLDPDRIKANLDTKRVGRKIIVYDSTTSTNDIAGEYARSIDNDGLVVFTEQQSSGRGRGGTQWISGKGESILCSIILMGDDLSSELLSLAIAVAVAEAIGKVGRSVAKIKWPNDIILNGKKVAGILVESKMLEKQKLYIIGIGINCHQAEQSFPTELRGLATSIDIESGSTCDRISLAKRLLSMIDYWIGTENKRRERVIDHWRGLSTLLGKTVTLVFNGKEFTGNCVGVEPEKGLILQLETGGVRMFDAAHTRILK